MFKNQVVTALAAVLDGQLTNEEIENLIEIPKASEMGDYAFPTFALAKKMHQAPPLIAKDLAPKVNSDNFDEVIAVGPYINFFLAKQTASQVVFKTILSEGAQYGNADIGKNGVVPIDMSSPNIAKPMSMGHLRSTVIGNALANILTKVGYQPVKINYLGDWGTQFGKLIVAYKKWGSEADVKADPIKHLLEYYVRFHKEAETDPELDEEARAWFKKLEDGDEESLALWQWFRTESLKEFTSIYDRLGIEFDSFNGEAFFNDKMDRVTDLLAEKKLLKVDNGAEIVDLEKYDLNPALIRKTDGATLYITRDLAAAIYRQETYHFVKALYVVGNEQSNHFKQLRAVLKEMGYSWWDDIIHVPFGLITQGGKKLSTRQGKVILLVNVLNDATDLALGQIQEKNPDLPNKESVADAVGVGAVIFHDLKNDRLNNFDFDLEEVVRFEGETGPYVQYTNARAQSILRKADQPAFDANTTYALNDAHSWEVISMLAEYPKRIAQAAASYEPSVVAKYAIHLAKSFNKYYANTRILDDDNELPSRLALAYSVSAVLTDALSLLGVKAPTEM